MIMETFAIARIIDCNNHNLWYAEYIGATVEVRSKGNRWVIAHDLLNAVPTKRFILDKDIEIIATCLLH